MIHEIAVRIVERDLEIKASKSEAETRLAEEKFRKGVREVLETAKSQYPTIPNRVRNP